MTAVLLTIWLAWAVSCWLAPMVYLKGATLLPYDAIAHGPTRALAVDLKVQLYEVPWLPGYAVSFVLFRRIIVVSKAFLDYAGSGEVTFIYAHEVAHHELRHPMLRLVMRATLLSLIPAIKRMLDGTENKANEFAEVLTGLPRSVVWGVKLAPTTGYPTEESEG